MAEPIISCHKLVHENGVDVFKPMSKLDFGLISGSGYSQELEFYIWNNFAGSRDVSNLQTPSVCVAASQPVGEANLTEVAENNWLYMREYNSEHWTQLGKDDDGITDLQLMLTKTLTGRWNDGAPDDPDSQSNFIHMVARLAVPINADITQPYAFDIIIKGKYV